jgi:hypothetical protein
VSDLGGAFLAFLGALLVEFDVDRHEDVHCLGSGVLILRMTDASFWGCSFTSQSSWLSSILRWVHFSSPRRLPKRLGTSCMRRSLCFRTVPALRPVAAGASGRAPP